MKIDDFKFCAAPVIECSTTGKIVNKNPAAMKLLPRMRKGSVVSTAQGLGRFGDQAYIAVRHEDRTWLIFADFLQLDFETEVFPHAEEYIALAGEEFLLLISELSGLEANPKDNLRLARVRRMLYERFSFIFRNEKNPARLYRIGTFFEYYVSAAKKTYEAAGGRVRFVVRCSDSPLMINARNAAVILTQLSSFLLFHSEDGRLKITAELAGEHLCLGFEAIFAAQGLDCTAERTLAGLSAAFPESAIDLLAIDMTAEACHYLIEYDIEHQKISLRVYLKTEREITALLDAATDRSIEKDLVRLIAASTAGYHKP